MRFILSTDTSCDVLRNELRANDIFYTPLNYVAKGMSLHDEFTTDAEYVAFYDLLREGELPTTSQINTFVHEEFFDSILNSTNGDIVHLCLSSGLSGTYNNACIAARNCEQKHVGRRIYVIDTLSATQGHRYLLDEARILRDEGKTAAEAARHLDDIKHKIHHWLIVDDLIHLKRGGRVSGVTAYIGTVLNIKPIIAVDDEGKLSLIQKVKGMKQGLKCFIQMMKEHGDDIHNSRVYIASGNSSELSLELKSLIQSTYNCEVIIGWIGPIIGTHTGNNTLGLVFRSKNRISHKK